MLTIRNEVWILADGRPGTFSQGIGLAEEMGYDYKIIHLTYSIFSKLPNFFLSKSIARLSTASQHFLKEQHYLPKIIISAGRRTAPIALYLKEQSDNQLKTIQIMHPNINFKHFDFVILPKHDKNTSHAPNVITSIGSLTRTDPKIIEQEKEKFSSDFNAITQPKIALFIGGDSKKTRFNPNSAKKLAILASKVARNMNAILLISNSRRTSDELTQVFTSNLDCDFQFFDFKELSNKNPYLAILGYSDYFIITGDSVSMICECASTGKPIYIFDEHDIATPKHRALHQNLFDDCHARSFDASVNNLENFSKKKLEETKRIAYILKQKLASLPLNL